MLEKKILILGGNKAQIPLIEHARTEGYYVIIVDNTTTNPGLCLADKHYQVNFMEKEKVLEISKAESISGVISNSEAAMPVVAYISEQLGLVGNPYDSILKVSSKIGFRTLQDEVGAYAPKHIVSTTFEEALEKSIGLEFPIILKPCRSSGSRGTTKILSYEELQKSREEWESCSHYSMNDMVVLEEYVEISALDNFIDGDIFICDGKILWDGLFTSKRSEKAPMIPMTQTYPIMLEDEKLNEVKKLVSSLLNKAGIVFGEYNIELYYSKTEKLFCIEINTRQGGNGIPEIIQKHCGIDMYKLLVTTVMGDLQYFDEIYNLNRQYKYISRHQIFSHVDGIYQGISIGKEIKPYIDNIKEFKQIGDNVNACSMAGDIIAWVDLEFDNREQQISFVKDIENYIFPIVDEVQYSKRKDVKNKLGIV
jgi:biotin carboxylase